VVLKKGMKVTCVIADTEIKDARIQQEGTLFFICQNVVNGSDCKDKMGYEYSWFFDEDYPGRLDIKEFNLTDIEDAQEGDIIVNKYGKRKVLGICGEVYFLSVPDCFDRITEPSTAYTITELKQNSYSLVVEEPEDDTVDITVEGKTKTISRTSAKELNLID